MPLVEQKSKGEKEKSLLELDTSAHSATLRLRLVYRKSHGKLSSPSQVQETKKLFLVLLPVCPAFIKG